MLVEIITPAVVGRLEQVLSWSHKVEAPDLSQVLGVHIGPVVTEMASDEGKPHARLTVDCDLWCMSGTETKVLHTRCRNLHGLSLKINRQTLGEEAYRIELVGGPRSTGVRRDGESLYIDFEATVLVEMTALTRFWVKASDHPPVYSVSDWEGSFSASYSSH